MYIIAEIGNMHEGSLQLAMAISRAAADCGVNCIKFQAHYFEHESLPDAPNPPYFKTESRQSYFERTSFDEEQWSKLRDYVENTLDIDFMCSPFSIYAVDILLKAGVKNFKIASGELTNYPLLDYISKKAENIFLSSGMSSYEEIDSAVKIFNNSKVKNKTIFQCTSEYPCKVENVGLNVIKNLINKYPDWQIGLSDHTLSSTAAILSLAKGAKVFEKHFTLSNLMYGSDAINSLEPDKFSSYVRNIKEANVCLNSNVDKDELVSNLKEMKTTFEKSIVFKTSLKKGDTIRLEDLDYKKPNLGISAKYYLKFVGKKLNQDVKKDYYLNTKMIKN